MRRGAAVLLVALAAAPGAAGAESFLARETAQVGKKWDYSVGVFAPLTLAIADGLELRTHPLLFLVSPNLDVRKSHWVGERWQVAGEYGVSLPTPAMRLSQGYLFPTTGERIGWFLVPHIGAVASRGDLDANVLTISADLAVGLPLSKNDVGPRETWAFLETELAPVMSKYRFRFGGLYDYRLSERWRLRGYADIFVTGATPSPLTFRAGANAEFRVGKSSRVSFGGVWWNSDQHAIDHKTMQPVRSNDFLPTLDFIWAG
ncbi:MAG: hypothetical protein ACYC8T_33120 [Myxococcaceae bacterium]